MKMAYERPVMQAELFATNAYCGACNRNQQIVGQQLVVDWNIKGNWKSNGWSSSSIWDAEDYAKYSEQFDLSHTFLQSSKAPVRNPNTGATQHYWTCNCTDHGDDVYYLEWSDFWTNSVNGGKDTFVLFKETGKASGLQIPSNVGSWPDYNPSGNNDLGIAQVTFDTKDIVTATDS